MHETTALGAAMAAGTAQGVNIWSLDEEQLATITTDTFTPTVKETGKYTVHHALCICLTGQKSGGGCYD